MKPQQWSHSEYHQNLLHPVSLAVHAMERTGVPVDLEALRRIDADMSKACENLLGDLRQWTSGKEVNWNSWQQLAAWMHNTPQEGGLGIEPSPYCKKGEVADDKIATDDRALEWLAGHNEEHRAPIQALRKLRQCTRMGRYARDWLAKALPFGDSTHRLHPSFGLANDTDTRPGAVTGRFGVKNPPLNQVPRNPLKDPAGMRAAFVPPPGYRLVVVDYSQLEIVLEAHLIALLFGDDDPLVRNVRAGKDIHGPAAKYIFGELGGNERIKNAPLADFKTEPDLIEVRGLGKIGIYGNNYGKSEKGFAFSTFLDSGEPLGLERSRLLCNGLATYYPGVPRFQSFIRDHVSQHCQISSLFGRWQPLPHGRATKQGLRNRAFRQAYNYPLQATGQEVMALALIEIMKSSYLRSLGYVLSLVVHDEIVGWAPEDKAAEALKEVERIMKTVVELLVPFKAEGKTGMKWSECK